MIKHLLFFGFAVIFFTTNIFSQEWKQKDDKTYITDKVIIGDSVSENAQLSITSEYSDYGGGGYGLQSLHSTDINYLKSSTRSMVGYSSIWSTQAQSAAFTGRLLLEKDNASGMNCHSGGGVFTLEFSNYQPYSTSTNYIHFLGGSYSTIKGVIQQYPNKSVISAVIGHDMINSKNTFGGYFIGKGFFSDSVGIGTETPKAKLQIEDGDIFISNFDKGIIMKSPNGNCWKGTIDNLGKLQFVSIDCPDEILTNQIEKKIDSKTNIFPNPSNSSLNIDISDIKGSVKFRIYNLQGKLIELGNIENNKSVIDVSQLESGILILELFDEEDNRIHSQKIVRE